MLAFVERLLTPAAARITVVLLLVFYAVVAVAWYAAIRDGIDWNGESYGGDFMIFWGAAKLAAAGDAVQAWNEPVLTAIQRTAIPRVSTGMIWVYPPTNLLLVAPVGWLSYGVGWFAWWIGTGALYLAMVRALSGSRWALAFGAAFPGAFVSVYCGQNGLISAALLGLGLVWSDRRPLLAGVMFGLMAYKPQLAILTPFLLAATGRWKAFASAGVTATAFVGLATAAYGLEAWEAFFRVLPHVQDVVVNRNVPVFRMPSVFVTATWLGAPREVGTALWLLTAVPIGAATVWAWRTTAPHLLKVGLAGAAVLLVTPYSWNYDLVVLAIPAAALMEHARRGGVTAPGWKLTVLLIALTPFAFLKLNSATGVQWMPVALLAVWLGALRALLAARTRAGAPASASFEAEGGRAAAAAPAAA